MKSFFKGKSLIYIVAILFAIVLMKFTESEKTHNIEIFNVIYFSIIIALMIAALLMISRAVKETKEINNSIIVNENGTFADGDFIYFRGSALRPEKPGRLFYNKDKKKFFIVWDDGFDWEIEPKYYSSVEYFFRNYIKP